MSFSNLITEGVMGIELDSWVKERIEKNLDGEEQRINDKAQKRREAAFKRHREESK